MKSVSETTYRQNVRFSRNVECNETILPYEYSKSPERPNGYGISGAYSFNLFLAKA